MTTHLSVLNKKAFTASLLLVLVAGLLPFRASAADFASTAPAATVARGQREVLTMNFSVPAYSGDVVADADGSSSEDVGVTSVQAGGVLYNISSAARLAYGVGGQSDPKSIWIDRDGSKKYTPNYGADTVVVQNDALGIPLPEGDVGATLKKSGMGSLKMLFSDPANPNVWHSAADALYLDTGTVSGLVDSTDVRVGTDGRFKQGSLAVAGKAAIIARGSGATCPAGIAAEDLIRIVGKSNIGVKEVIYDRHPASGACIATIVLYTITYPYAIGDQFEIVSPYLLDLDITDIKDASDNGAPDAQTTSLQITAGTAKGIAVGDTLRIARGGSSISYKVTELSSLAKIIKVTYALDGLVGGIGEPYAVSITNHAPWSGILTGMLESLPNFIGYADDNANIARDSDEPIYADVDGSNKVSKNDLRITNVRAEKRLLKKDGAVDALGGTYVDTATMGNPKWYSQTNPWVDGSDVVIDKDNDGFYNLDLLKTLKLKNEGTAPAAAITSVELWMEDNGVAGFQGTFSAGGSTDVHIGTLTYNAGTNLWTGAALNQPLIAEEKFYVTANVASNAGDGTTLRFAVIANGLATTHRTMPDALVTNSAVQTISAAAVIPPEQQPPVALPSAQFSRVSTDRLEVVANGQDKATIVVEVRDSNNQVMPNKTVTLERLRGAENIVLETKQDSTNALGITNFTVTGEEAGVFRFRAKVGSLFVGNATVTFTAIPPAGNSGLVEGDLFMTAGAPTGATVYYFANGKKYPFPNERVYLSWFVDFNSVTIKRITAQAMGDLPWGTNVRYRPGTRMIKVPDDPKVYAVTPGGTVCWVKDEATATKFYGPTWNKKIDDLLASLFVGTYHNNPFCDFTVDSRYPTGTIVSSGAKPFYIDNGARRAIPDNAWIGNRFRNEYLITVNNIDEYLVGQPVGETEFAQAVD